MADRFYYKKTKDGKVYYYSRESGQKISKNNIDSTILPHIKPLSAKDENIKTVIDFLDKKEALQRKIAEDQRKLDAINIELSKLNIKTKKDEEEARKYWDESDIPRKQTAPKKAGRTEFDYQQFANNYNAKNKTNYTADYWKKEFETKTVPKPAYKPDTSYANTHTSEKYSTHSNAYTGTNYYTGPANNNASSSTYKPFTPPVTPVSPEMKNPADFCNAKSNYPADILEKNNIKTKQDWKMWLKQNHVDRGGDSLTCGYIIAAGRSKGW